MSTGEKKTNSEHYADALREIGILSGVFGPITVPYFGPITVLYEVGKEGKYVTGCKVCDLLVWLLLGAGFFFSGMYREEIKDRLRRTLKWKQ